MQNLSELQLWQIDIFSLRNYGRHIGVRSPSSKKKSELISDIIAITNGTMQPFYPKNGRAATYALKYFPPEPSDAAKPNVFQPLHPKESAWLRLVCVSDNDSRLVTPENAEAVKAGLRKLFVKILNRNVLRDLEILLALLDVLSLHAK